MLTGKAKDDFLKWYGAGYHYFEITLNETEQIANIIEWFDTVNLNICVRKWTMKYWSASIYKPHIFSIGCSFKSRNEAYLTAIKKANEIYNSGEK